MKSQILDKKKTKYRTSKFIEEDQPDLNVNDESDKENDDAKGNDNGQTVDDNTKNDNTPTTPTTPKAAAIGERRRSKRNLKRPIVIDSSSDDDEEPIKKRGRPATKPRTKTHAKAQAKTPKTPAKPKKTTKTKNAQANADTSKTTKPLPIDFGIKAKCELTSAILSQYENYRKDPKYSTRYSAVCTICLAKSDGDEVDSTHFQRGNNSNLKSHLIRVISVSFFSISFRSMQHFKTEMKYVQLIHYFSIIWKLFIDASTNL